MSSAGMDNVELAKELRDHAEGARNSEHRPSPCVICGLADLAEEAANRFDGGKKPEPEPPTPNWIEETPTGLRIDLGDDQS